MSIGQNILNERILSSSCVLIIDITGVSHNLDFIFRNITVGTFHHGENIPNSGLKTVMGDSRWVIVRYPTTIISLYNYMFYSELSFSFQRKKLRQILIFSAKSFFQNLRITL